MQLSIPSDETFISLNSSGNEAGFNGGLINCWNVSNVCTSGSIPESEIHRNEIQELISENISWCTNEKDTFLDPIRKYRGNKAINVTNLSVLLIFYSKLRKHKFYCGAAHTPVSCVWWGLKERVDT